MELSKEKQSARQLMFADFSLGLDNVKAYLNELERAPEKAESLNRLLKKKLSRQYEQVKKKETYVSKFDIEGDFKDAGNAGLRVPDDLEEDFDFTLLFQLVASSFSSEYELEIDTETQLVNLIITVEFGEQSITKELQELWTFQILRLFEIYIQEQLHLEGLRFKSKDDKEGVEMEREMKLLEYRKKMRQIKKKLMNNQLNQQEIDDVEDEIDNLMNC